MNQREFTIVIPAKNEERGMAELLPEIRILYPNAKIIVVDDASTDNTKSAAEKNGAEVISHPYSKGNGAAIKTGLRATKTEVVVCMDGDGQHRPEEIGLLLQKMDSGFEMVVGARIRGGQAGIHRSLANSFYNKFASWMVGHKIDDLTSGFRVVSTKKIMEFINLLPNKFSYPTTITMSFFRAGYSVGYVPVNVRPRPADTQSHIRIWADGIRFLLIIFKIGTLFSPLKLFLPISLSIFTTGISYYVYTYLSDGRFTNMGALLLTTSIIVFLMGLISEQITNLLYSSNGSN
jgi:glycosyltransferase involved in cell wall biosynthesis